MENLNSLNSDSNSDLPREKQKKFRIYAKRLFLTYSRTNLTPSEVLLQFQQKFSNLYRYVISQEDHQDEPEKGKHIHAYLEFLSKVNILSSSKLDLIDSSLQKSIHGEYQAVKNKQAVIDYVKKDGIFVTNIETSLEFELNLQKIALEKGLSCAMDY